MEITLTNKTQQTTTINNKRYTAERVITEIETLTHGKSNAGNYVGVMEIRILEDYVIITDISGDFTRLTRF